MKCKIKQFTYEECNRVFYELSRNPADYQLEKVAAGKLDLILTRNYIEQKEDIEYLIDVINFELRTRSICYHRNHRSSYLCIVARILNHVIPESVFYLDEIYEP